MKSKEILVENVHLWRGDSGTLDPLSSFLDLREGRFAQVGPAGTRTPANRSVDRIDLAGRVVVPGLIDAHVHLELDPALRSPKEQLAVAPDVRLAGMRRRATRMLAAGITTARDCGGGFHLEHGVRDECAGGRLIGPRLLCCGQPVTTVGGHCSFWGGEVDTHRDIERMVARQIEAGSDWVKAMATGGVFTPSSRARDAQFDLTQMLAIVEAASRAGRSVAAHCHGTEGIANAVRAGVRTIEHASFAGPDGFGTLLDETLMREMAEREVWVSPTVNAGWGRRMTTEDGEETKFFERLSTCLRAQRDHGIRFIASTDAGIPGVEHHDLVRGLMAFERFAGLRPVDVLRSATSEAAIALGLAEETGRIREGLSADFLVLEGDPLEDLSVLLDPEYVVLRGEWFDRARRAEMISLAAATQTEVA